MTQFHLLFSGEITDEFDISIVKSNFKQHFQLSEVQIDDHFSGHEIIIKNDLTQVDALELALQIDKLGGVSYLIPIENESILPDGITADRRKEQKRRIKIDRRTGYRTGINADRRVLSADRRNKT